MEKTLIVITGPTGVGKTATAIAVARHLDTEIISSDSRQIYRGIPIGTAVPSHDELAAVKHHFIGILNLDEYYSAAQFETDVLARLDELFARHDAVVMCGGSMLYVDAVCRGIDDIPTVSPEVRKAAYDLYGIEGLEGITRRLLQVDPEYCKIADMNNAKRLIHALEIYMQAGKPYSALRTGSVKPRPFRILKYGLNLPRPELFDRINRRVDQMMEQGLEQEARSVYPQRHLNSLNTVGYKELFAYFDGTMDFTTARERIKKNTRVYAKKQLTWMAKDENIVMTAPPEALDAIVKAL